MKIVKGKKLKAEAMKDEGAQNAFKTVLIGSREGSDRLEMRLFKIMPGGHTPVHKHPWEHLVRIESGEGVVYSDRDGKFKIGAGQCIFIAAGEEHQFLNPYQESLELLCVIPLKK